MTNAQRRARAAALAAPALLAAAVLPAAASLAPAALAAQTATGNVRGYVTGTAGAPVPEAQITARYLQTNARRQTVTNAAGFYYLGGLRPGQYEITVRRIGLTPATRAVEVLIGQTSDVNVAIAEAAVALAEVRVSAAATGQQTARTSEVGTNISREQVANLPNFERNVLDLARLVPGVTQTVGNVNSTDKKFAAGGQPAEAVNIFIDGATYKSDILPGGTAGQDASKGNPFPQGAIQEFRVLTQNYKAEYQRASSAIIVANTRSGTNQTEADVFAQGINYGYAARDAFSEQRGFGSPLYRRLQAGASLGGPVVRDKLFYFGTYELNFRDEPAYVFLGGNAAQAPAGVSFAQYIGQQQQPFRQHLGVAKLTYVGSERNTVDASVTIRRDRDFRSFGGERAFSAAVNLPIQVYTGVVNWKYAGDRWLNEAQFTPQQYLWREVPVNRGLVGQEFQGLLRIGGAQSAQEFTQNRFSFRDDVTRSAVQFAGDHVFKVGGNVDLLGYRGDKRTALNPLFIYTSANGYVTPDRVIFGGGDPTIKTTNTQFGAYAQDDWTIGRKLTLNLGLRWDAETNPINNGYVSPRSLADSLRGPLAPRLFVTRPNASGGRDTVRVIDQLGGINRFISNGRSSRPIYLRAFQPRLGASYDFFGDGRTVVFGGGGLYYDRQNWNTFFDEQFRRQYGQYTVQFRNNCTTPVGCTAWNPQYLSTPATLDQLRGTTGVPEVFLVANNLRPPRTTQTSLGLRQAVGGARVTVSYNGVFGRNITNYVRASEFGGLGPNYLTAFVTDDRVRTRYNALQLQVERPIVGAGRFGGGLAYTLSKAEQQGDASSIFWFFDDRYPTVGDLPWRTATGDQRHSIVANGVARLPAGFLVSTIVSLASPVTIAANDESQGTGPYQRRTYSYVAPGRPFLGLGHVFGTQTVDLRLQKDVRVVSGQRVGLLVDLFNALNSSNFGCFNGNIPAPGAQNANYGRPGCAAPGRRVQIGLQYGYTARGSNASNASNAGGRGGAGR